MGGLVCLAAEGRCGVTGGRSWPLESSPDSMHAAPCFGASHTPDVGNLLAGCWGSELTGASRRSAAPLHGCGAQDPGLWCFYKATRFCRSRIFVGVLAL